MIADVALNPAEQASEEALAKIRNCLNENRSFLLEAGAGAGKTYSLIETLKYLIANRGDELMGKHQQIACITYTNVAADEITSRTDSHPAIHSSTIHAFCWSIIRDFQPFLRQKLSGIEVWTEKIEEAGGIETQEVIYDLGYRKINDKVIMLHHDDVVSLMVALLYQPKFQSLFSKRYPILLIDEYQDTELKFADALKVCFLEASTGPLIGFFGDHWQKIYGTGCGKIEHSNLEVIGKEANFRSAPIIVDALNRIRPELPQQVCDPDSLGTVSVFHTNNWGRGRHTENHWQGDLPPEVSKEYFEKTLVQLERDGWELSPHKTKILMLTHKVLATQQGYSNIASTFKYKEAFSKKEDSHIAFFVDILEPVCAAYENKRFGEMFSLLNRRTPLLMSHSDKLSWASEMNELINLRQNGTVGQIIAHLKQTKRPRLPDSIENKERRLEEWLREDEPEESQSLSELNAFKKVAYNEVILLSQFLNDSSPFSTKHGVKGAEFENILVVFGRGWNHYNFNQFLEWTGGSIPTGKEATFERNRNLFYVVCSRPVKHLCLLFAQELSDEALQTLSNWFGANEIRAI